MHKLLWSNKDHKVNLHDPLLEGGDRDNSSKYQSRNKNADIMEN
jgi:hypothetical protein